MDSNNATLAVESDGPGACSLISKCMSMYVDVCQTVTVQSAKQRRTRELVENEYVCLL
jgi:hypothetical protein